MNQMLFDKFPLFFSFGIDDVTHVVTSIGYPLVTVGYSIGYRRWLHHALQIAIQAFRKTQSGSSHGYENIALPVRSWCVSVIRIAAQIFRRFDD